MFDLDVFGVPMEFKFTDDSAGTFEGWGAVFNNEDSHGDVIAPGAFTKSIEEFKTHGTMPGMFAEHSRYMLGGDPLPVGVWTELSEEPAGLRVKGQISARDTSHGRRIMGLMRDGALKGLSIAYAVRPQGAVLGRGNQPKRTLKSVYLRSIDVVRDPSNPRAVIDGMKSALAEALKSTLLVADRDKATSTLRTALQLHLDSTSGGNSPTTDQRSQMTKLLQDAHHALTGSVLEHEAKHKPENRSEFEGVLQQAGFSNEEARAIAERGFKSAPPRQEERAAATREAVRDLSSMLNGFTLSSLEN